MKTHKNTGYWITAWREVLRRPRGVISLAVILLYLTVTVWVYTGWYTPDWRTENFDEAYLPPLTAGHWFGTDIYGRDVFAKTIYGTRVAVTVALIAAVLAGFIGLVLGLLAGYFGGWIDDVITWMYSTVQSIPYILLILAFAFVLQDKELSFWSWEFKIRGIKAVYLALGLTGWVGLCRLIRGEVIKHRDRDYVISSRSQGASSLRIIFRQILPNVFHLVIITFSLSFIGYIHAEVILSFLGLGVKNVPSWGVMIDDSKLELFRGVWWQLAAATGAIFCISLTLHIFGDTLRDALDPRNNRNPKSQ
ncbi:MAG: ABC transporter permease [Candidatus Auribacterota bacterium]|nr:ABC transporter permease [Candidatus Auribacterota bacterium]